MFDSAWIDIAIGVVVVWFLLALLVSASNEAMNRLLSVRSKQLWDGLRQILNGQDGKGLLADVIGLARPGQLLRPTTPIQPGTSAQARAGADATISEAPTITERLYATDVVQALENHPDPDRPTRIHNIPTPLLAQALIELARFSPNGTKQTIDEFIDSLGPGSPLKRTLGTLWDTAERDLGTFNRLLESWFDGQMSRLSELYKAKVRIILTVLGIGIAFLAFGIGLRSDALGLITALQHDNDLRTVSVSVASKATADDLAKAGCDPSKAKSDKSVKPSDVVCEAKGLSSIKGFDLVLENAAPGEHAGFFERLGYLFTRDRGRALLGVLITGIAISFGSTFWYDVLRRLIGIRGGAKSGT